MVLTTSALGKMYWPSENISSQPRLLFQATISQFQEQAVHAHGAGVSFNIAGQFATSTFSSSAS